MHHLRRTATIIAALTVSVLAMIAAAPAAFAVRLAPQDTGTPSTPVYTITHSGMAGWEITLIAVAAAVIAATATALVMRARPHPALRPAAR